ncbi:hypothetical protein MTR67_012315 [Solanum verrucosum]|uniref:DUF4283 domain-containing protein n=1 Tax=Solanum verrucosum TaxID=315347 RepID=A0AAF0QCS3_SOLVR|nr:hypothetical protein MTR67_012315 [Solanum verrucosum]
MLRSTKWGNEGRKNTQTVNMVKRGDKICIYEDLNSQSDVLKKSLVGKFMVSKGETPNLTEVRKWANNLWKQTHGLNIYEMGEGIFLFEFASKTTAEQVVEGDWVWKNSPVKMQWWSPTIGTSADYDRPKSTWVRVVGLPLHLWAQKTFKAIGDFCGGWVETEEETHLRNHLKWARIKINGDGSCVPKEVTIDDSSFQYTMQLWTEAPVRVVAGEDGIQIQPQMVFTQQSTSRGPEDLVENSVLVREGTDKAAQPRARAEIRGVAANISDPNLGLKVLCNTDLGPKPNVGLLMNGLSSPINSAKQKEEAHEEHVGINTGLSGLKTLAMQFLKAYDAWEISSMEKSSEPNAKNIQVEVADMHLKESEQVRSDESEGKQSQEKGESSKGWESNSDEHNMQIQQILDVEPVTSNMPGNYNEEEIRASNWVNQHILELSAAYGVAFEGFREETFALLKRLDERKTVMEIKKVGSTTATPRPRGIGKYELKNLQSSLNQQVEGSRTKGRVLSLAFK